MMEPYWSHGWGGMGWGGVMMVLFWLLLVVGAVLLLRQLLGLRREQGSPEPSTPRTALNILQERYARGEIGREEFEQKRRDLQT